MDGRAWHRIACVAMVLTGCGQGSFVCRDHGECRDGDRDGQCEAVGYCSFPDPACDGTRRRFGNLAPVGYAGQCVPQEGDDVGAASTGGVSGASPTEATSETTVEDPTRASFDSGGSFGSSESESGPAATTPTPSGDGSSGDGSETTGSPAEPCTGPGSFVDDFEDDEIDPAWDVSAPEGSDVYEQNGVLRLEIDGVGAYVEAELEIEAVSMLGGRVRIDVAAYGSAVSATEISLRIVEVTADCGIEMAVVSTPDDAASVVDVYTPTEDPESTPVDIQKPFTLQIRIDEDGWIFYELAQDGGPLVTIHSEENPCPTAEFSPEIEAWGDHDDATVTREIEAFERCFPG